MVHLIFAAQISFFFFLFLPKLGCFMCPLKLSLALWALENQLRNLKNCLK